MIVSQAQKAFLQTGEKCPQKYPPVRDESRLNSLFHSAGRIQAHETEKIAVMQRYRQAIKSAVARRSDLIATLA
mgnify:CR=1 FL=1